MILVELLRALNDWLANMRSCRKLCFIVLHEVGSNSRMSYQHDYGSPDVIVPWHMQLTAMALFSLKYWNENDICGMQICILPRLRMDERSAVLCWSHVLRYILDLQQQEFDSLPLCSLGLIIAQVLLHSNAEYR